MYSKTHLDAMMQVQTNICTQLVAGHMVSSWPSKGKKKKDQMITLIYTVLLDKIMHSCA